MSPSGRKAREMKRWEVFPSKTETGNPMTRATHPNKTETDKTQSDKRACLKSPISSERSASSECLSGPLGLKLDYSNDSCCAMVSGINASGMIPTWNLEHPSDAVTCLIEIQKTPANTFLLLLKVLTVTCHHEEGMRQEMPYLKFFVFELHDFFLEVVIRSLVHLES